MEIGCGNAILWAHNAYKIPENVEITLTDRSEGMLLEAQKKLEPYQSVFQEQNIQINYQIADANKLLIPTKSYDLNAPYILEKRADEFREMIKKKLEKEGVIYIHKSAGMFMSKNVEDGYVTP